MCMEVHHLLEIQVAVLKSQSKLRIKSNKPSSTATVLSFEESSDICPQLYHKPEMKLVFTK